MACMQAVSKAVCIDNKIFRFHYKITTCILIISAAIAAWQKYPFAGKGPIECTQFTGTSQSIIDSYCWSNSYVVVQKDPVVPAGSDFQYVKYAPLNSLETTKYNAQFPFIHRWIECILIIQAFFFFLPYYLWRHCWEHGRLQALSERYTLMSQKSDDDNQRRASEVVKFLRRKDSGNLTYAIKFAICELLNFVNVLAQLLILEFTSGLEWFQLEDFFSLDVRNDAEISGGWITRTFPTMTACQFPNPIVPNHSDIRYMCVLQANVVNRKIFLFLWLYFYALTIVSGFGLLIRVGTMIAPELRYRISKHARTTIAEESLQALNKHGLLGYGEWFVLDQLGKNMDIFSFGELVLDYCGTTSGLSLSNPGKTDFSSLSDVSTQAMDTLTLPVQIT